MKKRSFIDRILQNTRKPGGFWGRLILRGMNYGHGPMVDWALSLVEWRPAWNVLDIGCGGGANLSKLLKTCPSGRVFGIDYSQESTAFAMRKNARYLNTRCFIAHGDVHRLPYDDGALDAATAFETVYFWGDLPHAFAEVARTLRPGGVFMICNEASDPDNQVWTSRIEGMTIYSAEQLSEMLSAAGFSNIEVHRRKKEQMCIVARKRAGEDRL